MPPTPAPAKAEAQKKDSRRTEYVILRLTDDGRFWEALDGTVKATNKDGALRAATKPLDDGGTFKAVAKAAWAGGLKMTKKEIIDTKYEPLTD